MSEQQPRTICPGCGWSTRYPEHEGHICHPKPEVGDPRPCKSRNGNVCVAEGCYGEACRKASS